MISTQKHFQTRASVVAVSAALAVMALWPAAYAADGEATVMSRPTNTVEIGTSSVDKASNKFGEYNGLDKKGSNLNGGLDVRGGGYDGDSALRWRINATDLGLHTRNLGAEFGEQGKFRINFGYDEIQRKQYDNFQTIYSGAGSNYLYLSNPNLRAANHPAAISGLPTTNTAANITSLTNAQNANALASFTNIQSPNLSPGTLAAPNTTAATGAASANAGLGWLIPAEMSKVDIGTLRTKHDFGIDLALTPDWSFKVSARNETKEGLKLTGVGSIDTGHGVALPEPVRYTTNLYSGAFNYTGGNSHVNFGYYGSTFKNRVDTWMADSFWANNGVQNNLDRMVGAPDNQMHQFKLAAGYNFSKATKLTLAGSYAQSTQNESFIASGPLWYVPDTSAHAKVINTNFLTRLTSRVSNNFNVLASYRYEDRDNRTPYMQTISSGRNANPAAAATNPCGPGALPATAAVTVSGLTCYDNAPINIRQQQATLEGDYSFAPRQALKFGYDWLQIKRWSDEATQDPYRAHKTTEQTLRLGYRNSVAENLNGRIGYDHSQRRRSEYELEDPLGGVLGAAVEPMLPNLVNYMVANRDRDRIRSAINYQANDRMAFSAGLDYNKDKYKEGADYGKKLAQSWVLNLDGSWAVADNLGLRAFYTYEDQKSQTESLSVLRATNIATATNPTPINPIPAACGAYPSTASYSATGAAVSYGSPADWNSDPCRVWRETQSDKVHTFGLAFNAKASPVFDVDGSLTYTYALTPISFSGMQVINNGLSIGANGAAAATKNNIFIPTANMPDSKSTMWDFRIAGKYTLDKSSALRLSYQHRKLTSSDAQWDAYASNPVAIQGYVGTGVSSPNYSVNVVSVAYIYSFR